MGARGSPVAVFVPCPLSVGWIGGSQLGVPMLCSGPLGSWAVVEPLQGMLLCSCSGWDPALSGSVWLAPPFLCHGDMSLRDEGSRSSPLAPALRSARVSARLRFPL